MANLKLTLVDGLSLVIPSRTIRTRQAVNDPNCPEAKTLIRYRIGPHLRTRGVSDDYAAIEAQLREDKVARQDWVTITIPGSGDMAVFPSDIIAVQELDPEAPWNEGCSVSLDLMIDEDEAFVVTDIKGQADAAELLLAMEPAKEGDQRAKRTLRAVPASPPAPAPRLIRKK